MTYVLHYVSADLDLDRPNLLSWSVYREEYPSLADSDGDPIAGSTIRVSSHATEAAADAEANRLQATANDIGAQVNERLDQLADAIVSLKTPPQ